MVKYIKEVPAEPTYLFEFTQRDINLLVSILYDLAKEDAALSFGPDGNRYASNSTTINDLNGILGALEDVVMSLGNDYLSNFEVVNDKQES